MVALNPFCSTDDVVIMLGLPTSSTLVDRKVINRKRQEVEGSVRAYCRHNITQPTGTPATNYVWFGPERSDNDSNVLMLPQPWIRSVTEIREHLTAKGGQHADDFPAASVLTAGTDYWIDEEESGLSKTGMIYRESRNWPSRPRTVKVTYLAGITDAELNAEYIELKNNVIGEVIRKYVKHFAVIAQAEDGAPGPLLTEKLGDWMAQWKVETDSDRSEANFDTGLTSECTDYLDANGWVNYQAAV